MILQDVDTKRQRMQPTYWLSVLTTGIVIGIINLVLLSSFAALVFSGPFAPNVAIGLGYFIIGGLVISLISALFSSFPSVIALPQDAPTVVLAIMAATLAVMMPETVQSSSGIATLLFIIVLCSLSTGLFFWLLGVFNLGELTRFIPYPVIAGFLAGTGWLLVDGAIGIMTGVGLKPGALLQLVQPAMLVRWLPGLGLGLLLFWGTRRYPHPVTLPVILTATILLFHTVVWLQGSSLAVVGANGWLLGPFPSDRLWQLPSWRLLQAVDWQVVIGQAGTIGTLMIMSLVALLLNISSMELATQHDLDLSRELRVAGAANFVSGLCGGPVGYPALSLSALAQRIIPNQRAVGIIIALVYGAALVAGASFLATFPKFLLGGVILFVGLDFLATWLYAPWARLSRKEYAIIVAITVAIATIGMLEGVGLGILLAIGLFVVEYGRMSPIKHTLSGNSYRSNVDRPPAVRQYLRAHGEQIHIVKLQGFIFFGTANKLLSAIRAHLSARSQPGPRFLVLDFAAVTGIDASTISSFAKLKQIAQQQQIFLIFASLAPAIEQPLRKEVLDTDEQTTWQICPDLDYGVEWCEEQLLANPPTFGQLPTVRWAAKSGQSASPPEPSHPTPLSAVVAETLLPYMEPHTVQTGEYVIRQGASPTGLYFLHTGGLTAQLEEPGGRVIRLRKMQPGIFIGELSLYANALASASVVADQPGTVYFLSAEKLAHLEQNEPQVAAIFHKCIAQLVSERLLDATRSVAALMA